MTLPPRGSDLRRGPDPVPWVVAFFLANFFLQRVSVLPNGLLSAATPLVVFWMIVGLWRGVFVFERRRMTLWLVALGASGLVTVVQLLVVINPIVSVSSWLFWMGLWLPIIVRANSTTKVDYQRCARGLALAGAGISSLSVLFLLLQLVGVPYRDYLGEFLPKALQVQGFVISYPIQYGNPIYRSNAWFALEPSFLSFTLAVCAMCAIYARLRPWVFLWILAGLLATFAGSGLAVLAVAFVVLVVSRQRTLLLPHLPGLGLIALVVTLTPLQELVFGRVGEVGDANSSSSLRAVEPYLDLWPDWSRETMGMLAGYGAGSSRAVLDGLSVPGLLVPNIAKMLFDYGLLIGALLIAVIVAAHVKSPYPALAWGLLASLLTLQAGVQGILNCVFAAITWWAPAALERRRHRGPVKLDDGAGLRPLRDTTVATPAGSGMNRSGSAMPGLTGAVRLRTGLEPTPLFSEPKVGWRQPTWEIGSDR